MATTTTPTHRTVRAALAHELHALGVERLFGLVGEDTVAFVTEAADVGIRYFGARHENIAVNMADGYAWAGDRLGVATVTRGPGVMNSILAARTAARSHRRVLIISGDMATHGDWEHDYKSLDHGPLASSIGLEYFPAADPDSVVDVLREAADAASAGRTALISIPVDVLNGPLARPQERREASPAAVAPIGREPGSDEVARVVELVSRCERPLVLAGRGALDPATLTALEQLAERIGALLGTTLLARESFRDSPYNLGIVGGFSSDPAAPLLAEVDCVLAFGAALTPWTTAERTLFAKIPVVQVDSDPAKVGANLRVEVGIAADAGATARRLLEAIPPDGRREKPFHRPATLAQLQRPLYEGGDESNEAGLDPRLIAVTLDELLPEERTVVLDSGRYMTSPGRFLHVRRHDAFRHTADGGSIGMGLGIALGAQAARPDVTTVLFVGDGGLSMTMGDLETAVRNELPLVIVVMNDRAYGSELVHLRKDGLPWEYAQLPEIDFAAVATSLGIEAARVRSLEELRSFAGRLSGREAPLLLDCTIRQDLFVPRMSWA